MERTGACGQQRLDPRDLVGQGHGGLTRPRLGGAVAIEIGRQHDEAVGELRAQVTPLRAAAGRAVQQQNGLLRRNLETGGLGLVELDRRHRACLRSDWRQSIGREE